MANEQKQANKGGVTIGEAMTFKADQSLESAFGDVICEVPDNANVSEKFGRRSIAAVNIAVLVPTIGMRILATCWAALDPKDGKVKFSASLPRSLKSVDRIARETFLAYAETHMMAWAGFADARKAATMKLAGLAERGAGQAKRPTIENTVADIERQGSGASSGERGLA